LEALEDSAAISIAAETPFFLPKSPPGLRFATPDADFIVDADEADDNDDARAKP